MTNTCSTEIITMPLDVTNQTFTFSLDVSHVIGLFQSNVLVSLDDSYAVVELLYSDWMSPMQHWRSCCWMSPTKLLNYYAIIAAIVTLSSNVFLAVLTRYLIKLFWVRGESVTLELLLLLQVKHKYSCVHPKGLILILVDKRSSISLACPTELKRTQVVHWQKVWIDCSTPKFFFRTHRIEFCLHVLNWDSQSDTDESIDECIVCDRPDPVDSKDETIVSLGHCDSRQTFLGDVRVP
jgi:hypothetical protein